MRARKPKEPKGVQATTQTRLCLDDTQGALLSRYAERYGSLQRKLYALVAAGGGRAESYKTDFCRTHRILARLFNAMANDLQRQLDGTRTHLKEHRKDLTKALASQKRQLAARRERLQKVAEDLLRMAPTRLDKLRRLAHTNIVKIARLESKLRMVEKRLAANVPGICFGSRKLFKQQHHLELTSHADQAAWLEAWRDARSHQVFLVGSKDETRGNGLCQLHPNGNGKFYLKIRLPDDLIAIGESPYLIIENVDFAYDKPAIEQALANKIALTWRIHRNERGWRAFLSFDHTAAERITLDAQHGSIGLDF